MMLAPTGERTPISSFKGSAPPSDKFFSSVLKEQNKTDNVVPPVVIRNPYKKLQTYAPNIKQFCKPIYTPRSTVRNPYARDSKVEEQKQAVSLSLLTPKPFLNETVTRGGPHDMSSSGAPTTHDQKDFITLIQDVG